MLPRCLWIRRRGHGGHGAAGHRMICSASGQVRPAFAIKRVKRLERRLQAMDADHASMINSSSEVNKSLKCFARLWPTGIRPSVAVLIQMLETCGKLKDFKSGLRVHEMINRLKVASIQHVKIAIHDMYSKCGLNPQAKRRRPGFRSVVSVFVGTCKTVEDVKHFFELVQASGLKDLERFSCSLIVSLGRLGAVDLAKQVLAATQGKTIASWSSMLSAYLQNDKMTEALLILQEMDLEGIKPDLIMFTRLVPACRDEETARAMHSRILASVKVDCILGNAILEMYLKCDCFEDARKMFEGMEKDVVTWTSMIAASAAKEDSPEAFYLFRRMELEGVKPNSVTFLFLLGSCSSLRVVEAMRERVSAEGYGSHALVWTNLIRAYSKQNELDAARSCFDEMDNKDMVSCTAMIRSYAENKHGREALLLFQQMQMEGVKPNPVTLVTMLTACSTAGWLHEGKKIHSHLLEIGKKDMVVVCNELVNMYGQCGSIVDARVVFDSMPERTVVAWTAMIAGYAKSGDAKEALKLFRAMRMEGVKPNMMSLSSALLACSHAGLQDEAWDCFLSMNAEYGASSLSSQNVACMIDLLGRAGRVEAARAMINSMPLKPDEKVWRTLLNASNMHGNLELGALAAERLIEYDPMNPTAYLTASSMYAAFGNKDKEVEVLARMEYRNLKPSGYKYQFC